MEIQFFHKTIYNTDHYLRRFNELNEKRDNQIDKTSSEEKPLPKEEIIEKRNSANNELNYLSSANFKSIFIRSNSNCFRSSPFSIFPDGNFNF